MNLNPISWLRGAKAPSGQNFTTRESNPEGPYTSLFDDWVAREVNPWLYEAIREALGPIDGAINRIVTLDGIIRVEGDSDRLVAEIEDWMDGVQVNDMETGFQAFYRSQGNEMYEQGFTLGEPVLDERARDVVQLRVADSKGVFFRRADNGTLEAWYAKPAVQRGRRDGTDQVERVLRNSYPSGANLLGYLQARGYRQIDPARLVYAGFNNEADGPYGVSLMRSTEFDARVLLVIKNSLYQVWERFGNPSFALTLKAKMRSGDDPDVKRKALAENLAQVLKIKRAGNSADFVNVVSKDDEIELKVIGGDGQILEVEMPARHILENIVAKTGLPSWILGLHWSTAERLAERQGEIALQESRTRFATRRPGLERVVATMLRARGRTWKRGDWRLAQDLPNLQDLVAQAQARFLHTQADLMESGAIQIGNRQGNDPNAPKMARITAGGDVLLPVHELGDVLAPLQLARLADPGTPLGKGARGVHGHKAENYVEDGAALTRLERDTESALLGGWWDLYDATLQALAVATGAGKGVKAPDPVFLFDPGSMIVALRELEEAFIAEAGGEEAALARNTFAAWLRGIENASAELQADAAEVVTEAVRRQNAAALASNALAQATATTVTAYRDDIVAALAEGAYDGESPLDVARKLRQRFGAHEVDWERLARSEIAQAQASGKMDAYAEMEIERYDWIPAGDSCPVCTSQAANGPYRVGSGPLPMRDSHPNCRCTVAAVVEDEGDE